jgi:hypothetical protein
VVSSKICGSGLKETVVPRSFVFPVTFRSSVLSPRAKAIRCTLPLRRTSTRSHSDRAFTTLTPTPCRPPETLYDPSPSLSNLPPACSTVSASSTAGTFSVGCRSTGMPRPSSTTVMELSPWMVTSTCVAWPAIASSMELSTTSYTRWCRPRALVDPMYIPGRLRTASSPLRTWIWPAL